MDDNTKTKVSIIFFIVGFIILLVNYPFVQQYKKSKEVSKEQLLIEQVTKEAPRQQQKEISRSKVQKPSIQEEIAKRKDGINIRIFPLEDLNGTKKERIEAIRKKYLENSVLSSRFTNYKMNDEVFRIVDELPWIAADQISCYGTTPDVAKGPSRESTSIKNPLLLISFIIPSKIHLEDYKKCSAADYFFPRSLYYYSFHNTLTATFDITSFINTLPQGLKTYKYVFNQNEVNARDLGYNYGYIEKKENIVFTQSPQNNVSTDVYAFQGYIHQGYACGLQSGCNNYSPYQSALVFDVTSLPATYRMKLWKEKPANKQAKPDIYYEVILE